MSVGTSHIKVKDVRCIIHAVSSLYFAMGKSVDLILSTSSYCGAEYNT